MAILKLGSTQIGGVGFATAPGRTSPVIVPWTRPVEWMVLSDAPTQGVSALYGVENSDGNYVAVSCTTSAGNYTVNWGDGTSTTVASGVQADHLYNYSGITDTSTSSTTLTVDGMKQCVVSITPVSGNLTSINFNVKHAKAGLVSGMGVNWLEVNVQGASLAGTVPIAFGTATQVVYYNYLERINIGTTGVFTSMTYMFQGCRALRSIAGIPDVTSVVYISNMFVNCNALQTIPAFSGSVSNVQYMGSMFLNCYSLQTIPAFTGSVAAVTNTANMFLNCYSLQTIPAFPGSVANVNGMNAMFMNCYSLQTIPAFPGSVAAVTNMASMFLNCYSLQTIPAFPGSVAAVTTMASMFQNCYSLQTIPAFPGSVANVISMQNMFVGCTSLQTIPAFPGSVANITSMVNMFNGCGSLQTIPAFPGSVVAVTSMQNMFLGCTSLQTIPAFPGSVANVTNMNSMFNACTSLQTIPAFPGSVAAVTNMGSMFNGCNSLISIPTMDLGYNTAKDRAQHLTTPNWTFSVADWTFGTNTIQKLTTGAAGTATNVSSYRPTNIVSSQSLAVNGYITTPSPHGFTDGDRIQFSALVGGAGLTTSGVYLARTAGLLTPATQFKLTDLLGNVIAFTTNVTSATLDRQNMAVVANTVYKVTIVVDSASTGATYTLGGAAGTALTAAGTYVDYITATTTANMIITAVKSATITISSIIIEEVVLATTALTSDYSLASSNITGMRRSISYTGCKLSRVGIVNIFNNLGTSEPAAQVIDVSANHGTPDLIAVMATLTTSTPSTINTVAAHGLAIGDYIRFSSLTGGAGLATATTYKIAASGFTTTAFTLVDAATGLTPVTFSTNITAGTVNRYDYGIVIAKGWTATGS